MPQQTCAVSQDEVTEELWCLTHRLPADHWSLSGSAICGAFAEHNGCSCCVSIAI